MTRAERLKDSVLTASSCARTGAVIRWRAVVLTPIRLAFFSPTMRCPYCLSDGLFRSRSGYPWYLWPLRLLMVAVRCHYCDEEFRVPGVLLGGPKVEWPPAQKAGPENDDE